MLSINGLSKCGKPAGNGLEGSTPLGISSPRLNPCAASANNSVAATHLLYPIILRNSFVCKTSESGRQSLRAVGSRPTRPAMPQKNDRVLFHTRSAEQVNCLSKTTETTMWQSSITKGAEEWRCSRLTVVEVVTRTISKRELREVDNTTYTANAQSVLFMRVLENVSCSVSSFMSLIRSKTALART